jgi:hypothetical protein
METAASHRKSVGMSEAPGAVELLRLDYQQTTELLTTLNDVRFKLLALVPTLSGVAVALLGQPSSAAELLSVGVLGWSATLGILAYDVRNSELQEYALRRARWLEQSLNLPSLNHRQSGGLYAEQPPATRRVLGLVGINREGGLALVYSAALAGWSYLVAWGALRALELTHARSVGAAIGAGVGLLLLTGLLRQRRSEAAEGGTATS